MRKAIVAIALVLVMVTGASAQDRKKWYEPLKTKKFIAGMVVMAGMIALDHAQTASVLKAHPTFGDRSIFIGNGPHTRGSIARAGALSFGLNTGLYVAQLAVMGNDPSPTWRAASFIVQPAIVTAYSLYGFTHNRALAAKCRDANLFCN